MKNRLHIGLVAISLVFGQVSYAKPKVYFENNGGFFDTLTDGEKTIRPDHFGKYDLRLLMKDDAKALKYAELHEDYACKTMIMRIISGSLLLGGGTWAILNETQGGGANTTWIVVATLVSSGIPGMIGLHYFGKSRHFLLKAVNTFNGVDYSNDSELSFDLGIVPSPQFAAVGLSFRF